MTDITKFGPTGKWEVVRRLRYGALLKLFRHRYGYEFPDDDAGRDDLFVLLCVVSLAPSASDKKIAHTIEMWAPWMSADEAEMYVEHINRLTITERMPAAKELGERLNLTNAERERLKLWPIKPVDMSVEQLRSSVRLRSGNGRSSDDGPMVPGLGQSLPSRGKPRRHLAALGTGSTVRQVRAQLRLQRTQQ
jgi:hypothetical protein